MAESLKKGYMVKTNVEWALVTEASSGLGAEFAKALAARGNNLVLARA